MRSNGKFAENKHHTLKLHWSRSSGRQVFCVQSKYRPWQPTRVVVQPVRKSRTASCRYYLSRTSGLFPVQTNWGDETSPQASNATPPDSPSLYITLEPIYRLCCRCYRRQRERVLPASRAGVQIEGEGGGQWREVVGQIDWVSALEIQRNYFAHVIQRISNMCTRFICVEYIVFKK